MDALRHLKRSLRRVALVGAVLTSIVLMTMPIATAQVVGPCQGTATIAGVTYSTGSDYTQSNPIVVPEDRKGLRIPYSGSISVTNTNYLGAVGIVVGPITINVADWGLDENTDDVRGTDPAASYVLGSELDGIVGIYKLTAFHDADGGNCDLDAYVKLEGSVLSTPLGAASTAGAVVTAGAVLAAGIPKKGKP